METQIGLSALWEIVDELRQDAKDYDEWQGRSEFEYYARKLSRVLKQAGVSRVPTPPQEGE